MDILGCGITRFIRYLDPAHLYRLIKPCARFSGLNGAQNSTGQYISWSCGTVMPAPGAICKGRCSRYFRILSHPVQAGTSPTALTRRLWDRLLGLQSTSSIFRKNLLLGSQYCHREPDVGNEHAYCEPLCSQWDNDTVGFQILPGSKAFCPIFLHGVEVAVQLFDQRLQRAVRKFKKYIHVFLLQSLSRYFLGKSH